MGGKKREYWNSGIMEYWNNGIMGYGDNRKLEQGNLICDL
jgi:hypothetical protein